MKLGFISVLLGGGVYIACFKCKEYISMLNYQLLIIAKLFYLQKKNHSSQWIHTESYSQTRYNVNTDNKEELIRYQVRKLA